MHPHPRVESDLHRFLRVCFFCSRPLPSSIHYGKFVAESKFLSDRDAFTAAIRARDVATLTDFITKPIVEGRLRLRRGAALVAED